MKFNKIFLVSFVLLTVLTIGTVSASEDISDNNLTVDETFDDVIETSLDEDINEISQDDVDNIISDDAENDKLSEHGEIELNVGSKDPGMKVEFPNEINVGETTCFNVSFENEDVTGDIFLFIDGEQYSQNSASNYKTCIWLFKDQNIDFGTHTYKIEYSGDDNYNSYSISRTYELKNYEIHVSNNYGIYGENNKFSFILPNGFTDTLYVSINGKKYEVNYDEDEGYNIILSNLNFGDNVLSIEYDDEEHGKYSGKEIIRIDAQVIVPNELKYGDEIYLNLPSDASGTLIVGQLVDNEYVIIGSSKMKKGHAGIKLSDFAIGTYEIKAYYEGNDYDVYSFEGEVRHIPKITVPETVIVGDNTFISIGLPSQDNGVVNIYVRYWDEDDEWSLKKIFSTNVDSKNSKILTSCLYNTSSNTFKIEYVSGEFLYSEEVEMDVINIINFIEIKTLENNSEIFYSDLLDEGISYEITLNDYYPGTITVKLDGNVINKITVDEDYFDEEFVIDEIELGQHTLEAQFTSDLFNCSYKISFSVVQVAINIPEVFIENNDEIHVSAPDDAEGNVTVYINGTLYENKAISYGYVYFDLEDLLFGKYNVTVVYSGDDNYQKCFKSVIMDKVYEICINSNDEYVYGEESYININAPDDFDDGDLIVTVDGKNYNWFYDSDDLTVDISGLSIGKHDIVVRYTGDNKYYPLTSNATFNVVGKIIPPSHDCYYDDKNVVSLTLPSNAMGNLVITIYKVELDENDEEIEVVKINESVSLVNGKSSYVIPILPIGEYQLDAYYSGKDYDVVSESSVFAFQPKIDDGNNSILLNETKIFSISTFNDKNGILNINIYSQKDDDSEGELICSVSLPVVDGKAKYIFKPSKLGEYSYDATYYVDGEEIFSEADTFVVAAKIDFPEYDLIYGEENNVDIQLPNNATGKFNVDIYTVAPFSGKDGEVIDLYSSLSADVKNGFARVTLPYLPFGSYWLKINYTGNYGQYFSGTYVYSRLDVEIPEDVVFGSSEEIMFKNNGVKGNLTIVIDDVKYNLTFKEGKASFKLPQNLSKGDHEINFIYSGEDGQNCTKQSYIHVKDDSKMEVNVNNPTSSSDLIFTVKLPKFASGTVYVTINGKEYYTNQIKMGVATINVGKLSKDNYKAEIYYEGNSKYASSLKIIDTSIIPSVPKIIANDFSMQYDDGSKYSVTVYGADGNLATDVVVTFKINNKKIGTAKTNKNGVASIKITQVPKIYKITAEALGVSVTKKLTVKQILTLKKVKVKKSAKKLVLTATLKKVKGKYLKGKVIKFKFNGKTYKAKTNKKGVAKVTIKKSVLKKLKVGKKVKYQATYLKDTVKQSVKVKK